LSEEICIEILVESVDLQDNPTASPAVKRRVIFSSNAVEVGTVDTGRPDMASSIDAMSMRDLLVYNQSGATLDATVG